MKKNVLMLGFKEIETINNSYDTCEDFHLIQMEGKLLKDSLSRRDLVQKKKMDATEITVSTKEN